MEVLPRAEPRHGYHIDQIKFFGTRNEKAPSYEDIKRRAWREIVSRAILFAIAFQHTKGTLTPYQWLLYLLSAEFKSLVRTLKGGLDDESSRDILKAVSELVGHKVLVVLDEAYLLCGAKDVVLTTLSGEGKMNALSAFTRGIRCSGASFWIHSLVLLGTQIMSLELGARVGSNVCKLSEEPVVVLCKFPFLAA
jgi:hypothetical protein